jgi:outer membrane phospholipase A
VSDPELHRDPLPDDEPALSANEPVYFVAGTRGGANARFQLSFKYRLFDPKSLPAQLIPALGHMHLGYTQTSIWDLAAQSKPFRDTSYRPGFFWEGRLNTEGSKGLLPGYLRGGFEHESNGKDGASSRSINILYLQPTWRADFAKGNTLLFSPRFYSYLDRADNTDIARYRGVADWNIRVGDELGWVLSTRLRRGTAGYTSGQFDLSLPLRDPLFARTGGFLHFQIFSGYGESLLDYNVKRNAQFRIGFSIVR